MAPSSSQHRRTHNLLLISKLLNQHDAASPFTLLLDTLEQSARPVVAEYLKRAHASKIQTIFLSFETLKRSNNIDRFVTAWSQTPAAWRSEALGYLKTEPNHRKLVVIDLLNSLAATDAANLPNLLSSFISPTVSLLAVYHTDVPVASPDALKNAYGPSSLELLKYLATTIFTTYSLHHVLVRKAARDRSHAEPVFGFEEKIEGVAQALGANGSDSVVLEMEHRRKSGRGVREWYLLPIHADNASKNIQPASRSRETVMLLEDHPAYRPPDKISAPAGTEDATQAQSTFELGLTDKQRQDRDGVVLPYFDAQKGGGEGGRILYDMGSEDDFDEEEDEI